MIIPQSQPRRTRRPGLVSEDLIHDARPSPQHWTELMPVDGLRGLRARVAYQVCDLLQRNAMIAHQGDERVPQLTRRPVTPDASPLRDVLELPPDVPGIKRRYQPAK